MFNVLWFPEIGPYFYQHMSFVILVEAVAARRVIEYCRKYHHSLFLDGRSWKFGLDALILVQLISYQQLCNKSSNNSNRSHFYHRANITLTRGVILCQRSAYGFPASHYPFLTWLHTEIPLRTTPKTQIDPHICPINLSASGNLFLLRMNKVSHGKWDATAFFYFINSRADTPVVSIAVSTGLHLVWMSLHVSCAPVKFARLNAYVVAPRSASVFSPNCITPMQVFRNMRIFRGPHCRNISIHLNLFVFSNLRHSIVVSANHFHTPSTDTISELATLLRLATDTVTWALSHTKLEATSSSETRPWDIFHMRCSKPEFHFLWVAFEMKQTRAEIVSNKLRIGNHT